MRLLTLTLALITLLCTCARAQTIRGEPLEFKAASIAFIKNPQGQAIDSITIRTSIDTLPYGFAFSQDTLLLDVKVLLPVDELTIETFTAGRSSGKQTCWVDPPSADVHLSTVANQTVIDSVALSGVDRWYRSMVLDLVRINDLGARKKSLGFTIGEVGEDLLAIRLIEAYLAMPNLTSRDAYFIWQEMDQRFMPIRKHPEFQRLQQQANLLGNHRSAWFKQLKFQDVKGRVRPLPKPTTDYFLLEIYDRNNAASQLNHRVLQESPVIDSLLQKVPLISLTNDASAALWRLYVKDGRFTWLHGLNIPNPRKRYLEKWDISPGSTYLLVDRKFNLVGIYPDLQRMAAGVFWYAR